jgi:hypothetical protein
MYGVALSMLMSVQYVLMLRALLQLVLLISGTASLPALGVLWSLFRMAELEEKLLCMNAAAVDVQGRQAGEHEMLEGQLRVVG